jgi:glutamate/tyrosine decarboxylase-like PLP-dependent enzyme
VEAAGGAGSRLPVPEAADAADPVPERYVPSEMGRSADFLLGAIKEGILDHALNPAHPGYVGHMDSLASAIGIFSDSIVSACNNNMLSYEMSLVFTRMEHRVLRWACSRFGWDGASRGFLVSGGTLANIQALWVARNDRYGAAAREQGVAGGGAWGGIVDAGRRPAIIASEHAHYSFVKAANLLGLGTRGLIRVEADPDGRIRIEAAEEAIVRARAEGFDPFCLVGVAGTTITGMIEPLPALAEVARRHGLWFHVDAAYGGSLALSETERGRLAGCEEADSITWNPQKWLYVPKTCASLLFRDGAILEATIREPFVYGLEDAQAERPNLGEYTIQGTRRVDVLKLWLTLEHFGMKRLGTLIDQHLARARWFADRIRARTELELVADPDLSIVCFVARPRPGEDPDRLQEAIQREVARRGHGWLSMPRYRGRRVLRAVILHPRCDEAVLGRLLDDVCEARASVAMSPATVRIPANR